MAKQHVKLTDVDREYLVGLVSKGSSKARAFNRALALLELDKGRSYQEVAAVLGKSYATVSNWAFKYRGSGLGLLQDQPRPGRPKRFDASARAKVTALACTEAPKGHARWTVRLLAAKAVELGFCESISKSKVAEILKKTSSSRTSRNSGASPG